MLKLSATEREQAPSDASMEGLDEIFPKPPLFDVFTLLVENIGSKNRPMGRNFRVRILVPGTR